MTSTTLWVLMTILAIVLGLILIYVVYNFEMKRVKKGLIKIEQDRALLKTIQTKQVIKLQEVKTNGRIETNETSSDNNQVGFREPATTSQDIDRTESVNDESIAIVSDDEGSRERRIVENGSSNSIGGNKKRLVFIKRRN